MTSEAYQPLLESRHVHVKTPIYRTKMPIKIGTESTMSSHGVHMLLNLAGLFRVFGVVGLPPPQADLTTLFCSSPILHRKLILGVAYPSQALIRVVDATRTCLRGFRRAYAVWKSRNVAYKFGGSKGNHIHHRKGCADARGPHNNNNTPPPHSVESWTSREI